MFRVVSPFPARGSSCRRVHVYVAAYVYVCSALSGLVRDFRSAANSRELIVVFFFGWCTHFRSQNDSSLVEIPVPVGIGSSGRLR